jgi:hypothetical protein
MVYLDGVTTPCDRLLVAAKYELGVARCRQPGIGVCIARAKAERLLDMRLGLLGATDKDLFQSDEGMT